MNSFKTVSTVYNPGQFICFQQPLDNASLRAHRSDAMGPQHPLNFLSFYHKINLSKWPVLAEYVGRVMAWPAVQQAMKAEGLNS